MIPIQREEQVTRFVLSLLSGELLQSVMMQQLLVMRNCNIGGAWIVKQAKAAGLPLVSANLFTKKGKPLASIMFW